MPEEVQKAVDAKSSMTILGTNYMQYQAGQAMREAANQPGGAAGGVAGAGVGLGAGVGMGYMMVDAMRQQPGGMAPVAQPGMAGGGMAMKACVSCNAQIPTDAGFCPKCGKPQQAPGKACPKCGATVAADAMFCPKCGNKMGGGACAKCGANLEAGAKFCPKCGQPTGA